MIPANLSLVPLSHERRAVMQAIAEVEAKYERGIGVAEFPWARTFFRILNGSKRVTVKDIGWFSLGLTAQSLRGIDILHALKDVDSCYVQAVA